MGLDLEIARFLLQAQQSGVCFRSCLTLGRQSYFLGRAETRSLFRHFGGEQRITRDLAALASGQFSDPFWRILGAEHLDSMDASGYEGATVLQDLNVPVPPELEERYDVVFDGGTLEHVFNFPVALMNAMRMVRTGGRLITISPMNNLCGHGFYQLSPELFFRVLSPPLGFKIEQVVAVEYGLRRRWFQVADPEEVRDRVALIGSRPVFLMVQAQKLGAFPGISTWPRQSDYFAMWQESAARSDGRPLAQDAQRRSRPAVVTWLLETFPRLARMLESVPFSALNPRYSIRNRRNFRPLTRGSSPAPAAPPPPARRSDCS